MKAKFQKLCSFGLDIAEKLNEEPSRKQNDVIVLAVKAHYENRILPDGCSIHTIDITDFILQEIEKAEKVNSYADGAKLRVSSFFTELNDENDIIQVDFQLKSVDFDIDILFKVLTGEDSGTIQFVSWSGGSRKYRTIFDDNRIEEIEQKVSWKL